MATTIALNLIASVFVVAGLAAVCRLAYTAAAPRVRLGTAMPESAPEEELERRAA